MISSRYTNIQLACVCRIARSLSHALFRSFILLLLTFLLAYTLMSVSCLPGESVTD